MRQNRPLLKTLSLALGITIHLQVFAQNAAAPIPSLASAPSSEGNSPAAFPVAPSTPGRLFYTTERRQALDQQRKTLQFQETIVEGDTFTLNGIVTRSSGKWTLWINGSSVTERDGKTIGAEPVTGRSGRGRLSAGDAGGGSRIIAVGDGLERASGSVSHSLGNGAVRVHSRPTGR